MRIRVILLSMISAAASFAITAVPRTNSIIIDGDISDMDRSATFMMNDTTNVAFETKSGTWRGTNDLSAAVSFNYDDEYLYIGCIVRDENRMHRNRTGAYFDGDGVELFLSSRFSENRTNETSGDGDFQIYLLPPVTAGEKLLVYKAKGESIGSPVLSLYGITAASREFGDRYTMEIRVPLHLIAEKGSRDIGINIAVDDADIGGPRTRQMSLNGSPLAYRSPKYLVPLEFRGSFRKALRMKLPLPIIAAFIIGGIIFAGYCFALRRLVVMPLTLKLRMTGVFTGALIVFAAVFGALFMVFEVRTSRLVASIAAIDKKIILDAVRYAGRMDSVDLARRLYDAVCGDQAPDAVPYSSAILEPNMPVIKSVQNTPIRFEPFYSNASVPFTQGIAPVRATGVRLILHCTAGYPTIDTKAPAYRFTFAGSAGERYDHILTNGVNLFTGTYLAKVSSALPGTIRAGVRYSSMPGVVTTVQDEHAVEFSAPADIVRIEGSNMIPNVTVLLRAVTFVDARRRSVTPGPHLPAPLIQNWQGTVYRRYNAMVWNVLGHEDAMMTARYPLDGIADEVRVQFSGGRDSVSFGKIRFGSTVARIEVRYADGSADMHPIIDGLSYSTMSEVFGLGHPPHFVSKVSRRWNDTIGKISHEKEMVIAARAKRIAYIAVTVLDPETQFISFGVTAIRRSPGTVSNITLNADERRILSHAVPLVYVNGEFMGADDAPLSARDAARVFSKRHRPYDKDFRNPRVLNSKLGDIIVSPFSNGETVVPIALVHVLPRHESLILAVLRILMAIAVFFVLVSLCLVAADRVVDARRLSFKLLAVTVSLAFIPLLAAVLLFLSVYNRGAVADVLQARSSAAEEFIRTDLRTRLAALADASRVRCNAVIEGGADSRDDNHYLIHDVRPPNIQSIRYSAGTPARFMIPESIRFLKRSGPVMNSAYGFCLAWTTVRTVGDRVVSVTAFREVDTYTLQYWRERTQTEISIHYRNGYQSASLKAPYHFRVRSEAGSVASESGERVIGGARYFVRAFPRGHELQDQLLLIGIAVNAEMLSSTRFFIMTGGILFACIIGALAFAVAWWFSRRIAGAVLTVADGMKRVDAGDLAVEVAVDSRDETAELAAGFNTMAKNLSQLRNTDLKMAAKVQRGLLPQLPAAGRFDVAVHYEAFSYVSGDFYDFYTDADGALTGLVLFDVSGHGVSSGLITTLIRPILFRSFTPDAAVPLSDIIAKANRGIIREKGEVDNYLTCIMLRFSGSEIHYVNAGHPDIIRKGMNADVSPVRPDGNAVQGAFMGHEGMIEFFEETNRE